MGNIKNKTFDFTWELNKKGEVILTGLVDAKDVIAIVIPEEIDGRPVVEIGDYAFCECPNLRSIAFGGALRRIGKGAFGAAKDNAPSRLVPTI